MMLYLMYTMYVPGAQGEHKKVHLELWLQSHHVGAELGSSARVLLTTELVLYISFLNNLNSRYVV